MDIVQRRHHTNGNLFYFGTLLDSCKCTTHIWMSIAHTNYSHERNLSLCVRCFCVPECDCTCSHLSPLSLAADGSSNAICSASSDRESSTGRALRRDMDSLRLIIFILSIFSTTPPGPTGLRERGGDNNQHHHYHHQHHRHPHHHYQGHCSHYNHQQLHPHCPVNLHCTVKLLQCSLGAFSAVLWAPDDCVCSHSVCSHCYVSQVQTLQNKRHTEWESRPTETQRTREKESNKQNFLKK